MRFFLIALILLSCGCVSTGPSRVARYDMSQSATIEGQSSGLLLRSVEVRSPSWLATPLMQYRLDYAAGSRREAYGEARWVAMPAELLERLLQRRLLADAAVIKAVGCTLRVELNELVQAFDAPGTSRALLEIRTSLHAPRGDMLLSRRTFSLSRPAGADASAGAAAISAASSQLSMDVAAWLSGLYRETPELALRCNAS